MESDRRRLKILHLDPEIAWGGGESQVIGLLSYLFRWGHLNHLLAHPEGALTGRARKIGIASFPLRLRNEIDLRPVFFLRRLIREEKYDIVHFHTKRAHALSLWLGRLHHGVRYVVTRRMDYPVKKNWYTRCLYNRRVDGVIAISDKIAALLSEGGVRREKIRVIHSGVEPEAFQIAQGRSGDSAIPVIGTVAALEERKGHRFLLQAAAQLKRQGCRLKYRFAGEGAEKESLEKLAWQLGLNEDVAFVGFSRDVPAFLSSIDIFVLPSLFEGLGVAALEAMAAGKPVIASEVGGLSDLVENERTGLLVPPGDAAALVRAISRLVSQRGTLREMGERARERILRNFTVEQMAKKNEGYYYELLEKRPEP